MTDEESSPIGVADRVDRLAPSGIRRFFELAEARDDVVSLGVGEPDGSAPWAARTAAIDALERGRTAYTSNRGLFDLRAAIADHAERWALEYDPETEVLVTTGASEAVDLAMRALVDPGDTVAVQHPSYVSYGPTVDLAGGEALPVVTTAEDGFALTREALAEAGAEAADVLLFCSPNNPTGATLSADELRGVAAFCREHDLAVVADEIYAQLTYDGEHTSVASLPGMRERTLVVNGFSKAYAMTGLRLGYVLGPADAVGALNRVHQYTMLSAPTTAQHAALEALRSCDDEVERARREYDRRRRYLLSRFDDLGLPCFEAQGAFYLFPRVAGADTPTDFEDGAAFAEALLTEAGVAAVPGGVFGTGGEDHLRVSYAASMADLREATGRLEGFLADHGER